MVEHDQALQVRMKKLLKEKFQALDIARPITFYESLPEIPKSRRSTEYGAVLKNGQACSYFKLGEFNPEIVCFSKAICLDQKISLRDALLHLAEHEVIFLKTLGQVNAYVTVEDIQKAPVRMWLFGMITVVEMFFSKAIKDHFSNGEWQDLISSGRLEKARFVYDERIRRGQNPDLIDCIQFGDKTEIIAKTEEIRDAYNMPSKTTMRKNGKLLEELRNSLAHSQFIENWQVIFLFAERIDKVLSRI